MSLFRFRRASAKVQASAVLKLAMKTENNYQRGDDEKAAALILERYQIPVSRSTVSRVRHGKTKQSLLKNQIAAALVEVAQNRNNE